MDGYSSFWRGLRIKNTIAPKKYIFHKTIEPILAL